MLQPHTATASHSGARLSLCVQVRAGVGGLPPLSLPACPPGSSPHTLCARRGEPLAHPRGPRWRGLHQAARTGRAEASRRCTTSAPGHIQGLGFRALGDCVHARVGATHPATPRPWGPVPSGGITYMHVWVRCEGGPPCYTLAPGVLGPHSSALTISEGVTIRPAYTPAQLTLRPPCFRV